jgi:hypothetical protein
MFSQKESDYSYTEVDEGITGSDAPQGQEVNGMFWGTSFDYAVAEFTNVLRSGQQSKKEQTRIENARQQALAKMTIIKEQYAGYSKYPDSIAEGWHNVIATDNSTFCKDAKVYVKGNKIKKFVVDNYIPLNFTSTGTIKKAKNVITLKNFNGEQLNIMEVYFLYDIEEQNVVEGPINAGFVCFWTDSKNYPDIHLKMDNNGWLEKFTVRFTEKPECFANGTICRILKPGTYSFYGEGKGAINWKGTFEVRPNQCIQIRIGR